jgi:hypothetical protein
MGSGGPAFISFIANFILNFIEPTNPHAYRRCREPDEVYDKVCDEVQLSTFVPHSRVGCLPLPICGIIDHRKVNRFR